jgi:hypothetical protein
MNTKFLSFQGFQRIPEGYKLSLQAAEPSLLFTSLVLLWFFVPQWIQGNDQTLGIVDQSMWVLVVLSLISFMLINAISWWLLKHFITGVGLPTINKMVLQFKSLESWQQLSFYWASFALLLLVAMGCLLAIC